MDAAMRKRLLAGQRKSAPAANPILIRDPATTPAKPAEDSSKRKAGEGAFRGKAVEEPLGKKQKRVAEVMDTEGEAGVKGRAGGPPSSLVPSTRVKHVGRKKAVARKAVEGDDGEEVEDDEVIHIPVHPACSLFDEETARTFAEHVIPAKSLLFLEQARKDGKDLLSIAARHMLHGLMYAKGIEDRAKEEMVELRQEKEDAENMVRALQESADVMKARYEEEINDLQAALTRAGDMASRLSSMKDELARVSQSWEQAKESWRDCEADLEDANRACEELSSSLRQAEEGAQMWKTGYHSLKGKHEEELQAARVDAVAAFKASGGYQDALYEVAAPAMAFGMRTYREALLRSHPGFDTSQLDEEFPVSLPSDEAEAEVDGQTEVGPSRQPDEAAERP